jgi:hypothetical protein
MPKKSKKEKQTPNIVVFLVEGESDQQALEVPLANLIDEKFPEYQVRFLRQERKVNKSGDEVEDADPDNDGDDDEELIEEEEYVYGGDITSSSYVEPKNIETKITNRFIMPAVRSDGVYPKKIARVIQIVDLDGTYVPDSNIVPYSAERQGFEKTFYDGDNGRIEAADVAAIIDRNMRKRNNLEYLLSLPEQKIKIKTKSIPYEIYYFSSNLDHFINHDANVESGKKKLAQDFLYTYGLDTEDFTKYFLGDDGSVGHMGYMESWDFIKEGCNSVRRYTNIDCLIRKLM